MSGRASSSSSSPLPGSEADAVFPSSLASAECCEEHEEYLSLFCLDELEPLCKHCAADSHARHRVYLSEEAAIDCKEELKTSLTRLDVKIKNFEDVIQACRTASKCNQTDSHLTEEIMKEEFEKLHRFLREEEAARLHALMEEKEEKSRKAAERGKRLNQVITSLEDKIRLTERELHAGGEGSEYLQEYQDTMSSTECANTKPERIHRPLINVAKHLGNLRYAVWEKMKQIAPYSPVTLDPRTAGRAVRASSSELSRFHVTAGPWRSAERLVNEAESERLHPHPGILAREGFSTGVHCWDTEVGETDRWTVGVAALSALKTTTCEASPEAGLWCIRLKDGEYLALTTPTQTLDVGSSRHLNRVRVKLDLEGGTVTFVDADTDAPLFTFTHCFTGAVYPYFESSSAGGGVAVLEQRVKISVDSEDRPAKGNSPTEKGAAAKTARETDRKSVELCCAKREEPGKPEGKEKTPNTRDIKKQSRKSRFNVSYHVSLNKALSNNS
ncbi:tripartite motif-containing protein 35-like isoform X1 [Xiphophorus hellerii]|uniref:tripartite motif-containing protein 35-like isoform X1 n=1 Tax=Xiphophorus hellerii TaxID=8084 RepID=UPI0013B3DF67|nr:tripartite motif-containing protein 35-like isoform X1 [Xiphophorus hellerii]